MEECNSYKSHKDPNKPGPSGMSQNTAFSLPHKWGGQILLLPIDTSMVKEIKEYMGGDQILDFVTPEYSAQIQLVYDRLGVQDLNFDNVWEVFKSILAQLNEQASGSLVTSNQAEKFWKYKIPSFTINYKVNKFLLSLKIL